MTMLTCGLINRKDKRPKLMIKCENKPVTVLFDSGAETCVASAQWLRQNRIKVPMQRSDVTLTAAGGNKMAVIGTADLRYTFGKMTISHPTLIVDGLRSNLIIGADLMEDQGMILDHRNKKISIVNYMHQPITAKQNYLLEPWKEKVVEIECLSMPANTTVLTGGPNLDLGVTSTDKNKNAKIALIHKGNVERKINKGDCIGYVRQLKAEELEVDKNIKVPLIKKKIPTTLLEPILQNVPAGWREKYAKLMQSYSDCFAIDPDTDIGRCGVIKQDIRLQDESKIHSSPARRIPFNLFNLVKQFVQKMLQQRLISPSVSPYNSPIMLVPKPNAPPNGDISSRYRICNDFRSLNSNTIKDKFPLVNLEETLQQVATGKMWSQLDISQAFFQQELTERSKPLTTFNIPGLGSYCYQVSPMGTSNSTSTWSRLITYVFRGLEHIVKYYIDDLIVLNMSGEHPDHLKELTLCLERLRKFNLKCRLSKTRLAATKITFLGHELERGSIRASEAKTMAIQNFPPPHDIASLRRWLGLTGWYRKTIYNYSVIANPLTRLLRNDSTWKSGTLPADALLSFNELKSKLMQRPCLQAPKYDRRFWVSIDASSQGFGLVLSQFDDNKIEHPVVFLSRKTTERESKWPAFRLESESLIWGLRAVRVFTAGAPYTVKTDHKPLCSLNRAKGELFEQVYEKIQPYLPFDIVHCPGIQNKVPDAISRCFPKSKNKDFAVNHISVGVGRTINVGIPPLTDQTTPCLACRLSNEDNRTLHDRQNFYKSDGKPDSDSTGIYYSLSKLKEEYESKFISSLSANSLHLSTENIINYQKQDLELKSIMCFKRYSMWPKSRVLANFISKWASKTVIDDRGIIGHIDREGSFLIFVPKMLRQELLRLSHHAPLSGHQGFNKSWHFLSDSYFWPEMKTDLTIYIQSCETCGRGNPAQNRKRMPLREMEMPTRVGEMAAIDLLGPLPDSNGYKYVVAIQDLFSSYIELIPIPNKQSGTLANAFIDYYICNHSIPKLLISDLGSENTGSMMKEVCKRLQITQRWSSVAHPNSNPSERIMRITLTYLRKYLENNQQWSELIHMLKFSYNSSIHQIKNCSPFYAQYNRRPTVMANIFSPERKSLSECPISQKLSNLFETQRRILENKHKAYLANKKQYDKNSRNQTFVCGQIVYCVARQDRNKSRKFSEPYQGPFYVKSLRPRDNLELMHCHTGKIIFTHANRVKTGSFLVQHFDIRNANNIPCKQPISSPLSSESQIKFHSPLHPVTEEEEEEAFSLPHGQHPPISSYAMQPTTPQSPDGSSASDSPQASPFAHNFVPSQPLPPPADGQNPARQTEGSRIRQFFPSHSRMTRSKTGPQGLPDSILSLYPKERKRRYMMPCQDSTQPRGHE